MNFNQWEKSNAEYGRKLMHSGIEGARSGREAFLSERPLVPFFSGSARKALTAAAIGVGLGLLRGCSANGHRSKGRALAFGLFGGAIGFGAGVVWETRLLGKSVVAGAWRNIGKVRDEHWLEKNPIDYA
jgi:hypothetical protein